MNINTRFSVGVHVLTMIAVNREGNNTSELLAKSINTNPVVVRRLMGQLKRAGLLSASRGVSGTELCRPPEEITLLDVYCAVNRNSESDLFHLHTDTNPNCYIARNIHDAMKDPLKKAECAMEESLSETTIADLAAFIMDRVHKGTA